MTQLKNKTILITGGASGIGKIMSRLSLERDANVIIWDINTQNIENTLKELSDLGNISTYVVDVSNLVQIQETAKKIKDEHGNIDILINNAGIVVGKYFHEHTAEEIEKTISSMISELQLNFVDEKGKESVKSEEEKKDKKGDFLNTYVKLVYLYLNYHYTYYSNIRSVNELKGNN